MSNEPGLFEVLYTCRAMRRLKSDPVPRELLLTLIDAANQAPSGSNQQRALPRALGLGAAPTTLGLPDGAAVAEVLGPPDTVAAFCLIPVGWPMGKFGAVTRRTVEQTMRWDGW